MRFLAQNATIWLPGSTPPEPAGAWGAYTALPYMIPSTNVAGFKRWAREGGEWEGRKGSKIKGEAEGVRKGWEGWEKKEGGEVNRGKWGAASILQQFSKVGAYGARRSVPGPPQTTMAMRYVSVAPQHIPLECSRPICWTGKFIVGYCIDVFYFYYFYPR